GSSANWLELIFSIEFLKYRRKRSENPPLPFSSAASALDKSQEILVNLLLMGRAHPVGGALVNLEGGILDQLGRPDCGYPNRDDLVIIAVQNQSRHLDFFQILSLVRFGKRLDAKIARRKTSHHPLKPE